MQYASAASKPEAVARMYRLGGVTPEPLGPGSKEKRSALESLASAIAMDLTATKGKVECARSLAEAVRVPWDSTCFSAGDTITLVGMNRLVDGVVDVLVSRNPSGERELIVDLMGLEPAPRHDSERRKDLRMEMIAPDVQKSIAELLAALSQSGEAPQGVEFAAASLDASEVRFDDGTWRDDLGGVQGWLNFAEDLDTSAPDAFDRSLVVALGLGPSTTDVETVSARLLERLEKATALRAKFEESLEAESEGAATLGSATQVWQDAWQDIEDEDGSESGGPIKAMADTWPIAEFVQLAKDDDLELSPSYQRADVWPTADAQQLIESVLRGIPLPSVILLQNADDEGTTYEVVDGKQRLTSVLRFTGNHPVALATVRAKAEEWGERYLEHTFREDYPEFRRLWKKYEPDSLTAQVERLHYFPFALRKGDVPSLSGDLEALRGKYYSQIRKSTITVVGERKKVDSLFEQQSKYKLPVIVYESVTPAQVHEVFSLYNKQGKHLNAEEIRNALYHHLALMRGLLVTAGDSASVHQVAPFLAAHWDDLSSTPEVLDGYGFGKAGYKRTKLLSWVLAGLVVEDEAPEITRSTAAHISGMLKGVAENRSHALREEQTVLDAMLLLDHAVDAHAEIPEETWSLSFKQQAKWQELQLVGSLIALAAARAIYEESLSDVVEAKLDEIAQTSGSAAWMRPKKTQSKEQWKHTGRVVASFLRILDVEPEHADRAIKARFGSSGIARLVRMAEADEPS
ncbi:DUF262 domain-containing protein [Demequina sp. NBRC 110056]|uniref:DUF262 domain-containing protein n=1 Tax=Demequina sp. NBRC 110056 TaxID=1570345 RepID=UPI001F195BE3|nr:DUF262 domain-containing protein [Demequina sp. NBRC 110056]